MAMLLPDPFETLCNLQHALDALRSGERLRFQRQDVRA